MSDLIYQSKWREGFEKRRADLVELVTWDPFENWERNRGPESKAERQLGHALAILYAGSDEILAQRFLTQGLAVADRAFKENKFTQRYANIGFPRNRGQAARTRTYARALLDGTFSPEPLIEASEDYEEWCRDCTGATWDSLAQSMYLTAVRLALIAGDLDRAAQLLQIKKKFKWHPVEHRLLKRIAAAAPNQQPIDDPKLFEEFDAYFDMIRDPDFKPDVFMAVHIARFEMGVIRHKYFVSRTGDIDWHAVIEAVRR